MYNFKNCKNDNADAKIKLCTMTFDSTTWDRMSNYKKSQLNETATYFFHLLYQFAKLKKTNNMNIVIVENDLQELTSPT